MKLENAALHRFLALAERHMPKKYKLLFSEQAPTQQFVFFVAWLNCYQYKQILSIHQDSSNVLYIVIRIVV